MRFYQSTPTAQYPRPKLHTRRKCPDLKKAISVNTLDLPNAEGYDVCGHCAQRLRERAWRLAERNSRRFAVNLFALMKGAST